MKEKTSKSSKKMKKEEDGNGKNKNMDSSKKRRFDEEDLIIKKKQKDTDTDTDTDTDIHIVVDEKLTTTTTKKKKKKKDKTDANFADIDEISPQTVTNSGSPLKNNVDNETSIQSKEIVPLVVSSSNNNTYNNTYQYQSNEDICNNVDRTLFIDNICNTIPSNKSSFISVQDVIDFVSTLVINIVVPTTNNKNTNISKDMHKEYIDNIIIPVWNDTQKIRGYGHITFVSKDYANQVITTYNEYHMVTNSTSSKKNNLQYPNFTFYNKSIRFQHSKQPIKNSNNNNNNLLTSSSSIHDNYTGIEKTVSTTLILNNLSFTATDTDIHTALRTMVEKEQHDANDNNNNNNNSSNNNISPLDSIVDIIIPKNKNNNKSVSSKGYAYIVFETTQAARRIMILASSTTSSLSSLKEHPFVICGRPCQIDYYHKTTTTNSPNPFGSPTKLLLSSSSSSSSSDKKRQSILSRGRSLSLNRLGSTSSGKLQRSRTASPIKIPGSTISSSSLTSIDNKMRPYNLKY